MTISEKLLAIKNRIEQAKNEKAQLEGKLESQYEALNKLGCKSIEEAQKKLKEMSKKLEKLEKEVEEGLVNFEKKYGF